MVRSTIQATALRSRNVRDRNLAGSGIRRSDYLRFLASGLLGVRLHRDLEYRPDERWRGAGGANAGPYGRNDRGPSRTNWPHIHRRRDLRGHYVRSHFRRGSHDRAGKLSRRHRTGGNDPGRDDYQYNHRKHQYSGTGGGAAAGPDNGQFVNYSTVRADLISNATRLTIPCRRARPSRDNRKSCDLPRDFRASHYLRDCPPNRRSGCASQGLRTSR